jgi:HlyD family secretion protein
VLLVLVAAAVVSALPKPVEVETGTVNRGPLVVTVNEDGITRVKDRYVLSAPLSGNVARIELDAGDAVKRGTVLARILPARTPLLDARTRKEAAAQVARAQAATQQARAQIERARAALDYSKKEAARSLRLYEQEIITQAELDRVNVDERTRRAELTSAEFADKVAQHELSMARAALGRFEGQTEEAGEQFDVPSPIDGRVLKVLQQSEGVVAAGAPLLEVGDPGALEIAVDVLTSDAVHIKPGRTVAIEEWGGPPLKAAVRMVEPSAFTKVSSLGVEEQRVNTIIDLNEPYERWSDLGDGYRVEARIVVYRADKKTRVPAGALFRRERDWAAFAVVNGRAELRKVELGRRNDVHAEVEKGLAVGERVIVHPSDQVADGVEVAY